jgi:hypothetical protein
MDMPWNVMIPATISRRVVKKIRYLFLSENERIRLRILFMLMLLGD